MRHNTGVERLLLQEISKAILSNKRLLLEKALETNLITRFHVT